MEGVFSLDSLRIRIPLSQCTDISHKLNDTIQKASLVTGELYENDIKNWEVIETNGIKTRFSVGFEKNGFQQIKCLSILINSKMLKTNYFTGINKETLPQIYQWTQEQRLATFTYDTFLDAYCTDIDVKKDFVETTELMESAFELMKKNAIPNTDRDKGCQVFYKNGELTGMEFNKRKNSNISAPFLKIYYKSYELENESIEFSMNYLTPPPNLWRCEFTIRNSKHLKALIKTAKNNKLLTLMELTQEDFLQAYEGVMRRCLGQRLPNSKELIKSQAISPQEVILINALTSLMDFGLTLEEAKRKMMGSITGSNKTKWSGKFNSLFASYIKPIENYSNYDKLDSTLAKIGYMY